jgi:DNA-binding CsgD family transcriptional regulator
MQRPCKISSGLEGMTDADRRRPMVPAIPAAALIATLERLRDAAFLVDADARPLFVNAAGLAILARRNVLGEIQGILTAVDVKANRRLRHVLSTVAGGAVLLTASKAAPWIAHVKPLGTIEAGETVYSALAALVVRKTTLDWIAATQAVAELFELTAGELRVLRAVVELGGARDVTKVLGVSEATVRTHLHHVYQKTGARRQVDLAKLVAGVASPFT